MTQKIESTSIEPPKNYQPRASMKVLLELVYILKRHKIKSIDIVGDIAIDDSKLYQLYEAIRTKTIKTDLEAALLIYNEKKLSPKYRNLKHTLKSRLISAIFSIEFGGEYRKRAFQNCWKEWSACMIIREQSAIHAPLKIAQKVSKQAIAYEFNDLVISTALFLRTYYSLRKKDTVKFNYYNDLYHKYTKIEEHQNLAHELYMKLILDHTSDSVTVNPQIKEDSEKYHERLINLKSENHSTKFYHYLYQIQLLGTMGVFDYIKSKSICEEALLFFGDNANMHARGQLNFLLNKLVCHIQLKEFEEGKKTAGKCEDFLVKGEFGWFRAKEYFFMLSIYTGNYQEAYYSYIEITEHNRFKAFKSKIGETWLLYRMYIHFLIMIGKIQIPIEDKHFNNTIRLGKFLNEVPSFSKDKHGMNIPVLIIQMTILILQKNYDKALDRIESLEKYCSRYLKKDNPNFRCNCFIRMLLQIPISDFHRAGTERRAQKHLDKMKTVEVNFNNQAHEVEVLPFEVMWEFILDSLQNKFYKPKKRVGVKV